ncbi:hypothetical protein LCL96_14440 [Rossellomorea aquimaris]|uniref:hypothetical protein n=1 Tax=Rossellomorea aquimaris TaxID=189382 RepID=UPI001CD51A34|nr:hypothetical protein [Rossellomorea aquimaris]MCA1060133.1 hypothetical protein [Rossellomorea aquimaris]
MNGKWVVFCTIIMVATLFLTGCLSKDIEKVNDEKVVTADVDIVFKKKGFKSFPNISANEIQHIIKLYNESTYISDIEDPEVLKPTEDPLSASAIRIELDTNKRLSITYVEEGRFKVNYEYKSGNRSYLIEQDLLRDYLQRKQKEAE